MYNIVCDSLNLIPQPNNGTLRLPLKPVGVHSPETTPEEPLDPTSSVFVSEPASAVDRPVVSAVPSESTAIDRPVVSQAPSKPTSAIERPVVSHSPTVPGVPETTVEAGDKDGFWDILDGDYLAGKLEEFKNWLGGFFGGGGGGEEGE